MFYKVHTTETVHGIYHVEAASPEAAQKKLESGEYEGQELYEAFDVEVDRVETEE